MQDPKLPIRTGPASAVHAGRRTLNDIIAIRLSRRNVLAGLAAGAGSAALGWWPSAGAAQPSLAFAEIEAILGTDQAVASGYRAQILIRWGDPVFAGAPEFRPDALSPAAQLRQFGYNNDFVAYMPLPRRSENAEHGLLCVNHEYTDPALMWPRAKARMRAKEQTLVEMAAQGASIIEVKRDRNEWSTVSQSRYNRRITAGETAMDLSGPAAGHARLRTKANPKGLRAIGTFGNCGGGVTPWGTVLSCEENFQYYFAGDLEKHPQSRSLRRYGVSGSPLVPWFEHEARFDFDNEPNEVNRFGWVVEFDPYQPERAPVKRTALGRFKHECAETVISADGRLVVYGTDDETFEYLYRFVSDRPVDPENREANRDLLDHGILSVARFDEDDTLQWRPLVYGRDGLDTSNGFHSQADVLIDTRLAADIVGATALDRPEGLDVSPSTGRVFVMLTGNTARTPDQVDKANPRPNNRFGHILELSPPGSESARDHTSARFHWQVFLLAGDQRQPDHGARYHAGVSDNGWLMAPDNCAFDPRGRLWIATDRSSAQHKTGRADGLYACETVGPDRALTRLFYKVPVGAECTGPCFTPDGRALFLSVQHPGEKSGYAAPSTRWPDFKDGTPPRPAVVAITKEDGGEIGS